MTESTAPRRAHLAWTAIAAVIATYALVVVGGIVRVSGSGLGCPDWPLCQGQVIPQLQGATLIEFSHRVVSTLVSLLVLGTAFIAWRRHRRDEWVFRPALLAVALLAAQIALGGITVLLDLAPVVVAIHLGNALLLLACLICVALFAMRPGAPRVAAGDPLPRLALASTVGTFLVIISGSVVTGTSAHYACTTWPLCGDELIPPGTLPLIAALHRYAAGGIGGLILYTLFQTWRTCRTVPALRNAALAAAILFVVQIAVGAVNVMLMFPLAAGILHLASAAAVWAGMVAFTVIACQTSADTQTMRGDSSPEATSDSGPYSIPQQSSRSGSTFDVARDTTRSGESGLALAETGRSGKRLAATRSTAWALVANYVLLTKPWIVALLLTTTIAAMLIAERGLPEIPLLAYTLLGGALTAGGASALNSYIDRDIDPAMGRTARRPLPAGRIKPRQALIFGVGTCALGVGVLALRVNGLSALLAFAGIVYYVVIYTMLLKRSTPQNVVIGGAAGAIPPLVGWAAVTNQVNLLAIYLFLIIFYWTPPHTWALMLMVRKDYERVGVPMMPVARGEEETRRQIVLYSLLMVVLTLIPFSLRDLGWLYLLAALLLGGWFVYLAFKVLRDGSKRTARRLYLYSNAYLALLFLAMVIDHGVVGAGRLF